MRQLTTFIITLLTLFTLTSSLANTQEYMLDNGLKLIVRTDTRAPVVVSMVWYKIGSAYEPLGITGVSHVLEHMMFKGTEKYAPGEVSRLIALHGGEENAFTSNDFTAYFQELSSDDLSLSFETEADRMRNSRLDKEEFLSEIEVIKEERRLRTDDNPQAATLERFRATAHIGSPYHQPVIGWMNDLENMTIEDVRTWYDTWYAPNNAIVVVVGNVVPDEVYALAKKTFGPLKPSTLPAVKPSVAPPYVGTRYVNVEIPAQTPWLVIGYNVPAINTASEAWEPYALDLITDILGRGRSSRLNQNLVRGQQIASNVGAYYEVSALYDTLLFLHATPVIGEDITELQAAMMQEITSLQEELVSDEELDRLKIQAVAQRVYGKDSNMGQAMEIGALEAVGIPWQVGDEYVANLEAITAEQIQLVAKKYLTPHRLTIAELTPENEDAGEANDE